MKTMKISIKYGIVPLFILFFASCKKEISNSDLLIEGNNLSSRVINWLNSQKDDFQNSSQNQTTLSKEKAISSSVKNENIDLLIENLDFNSAIQAVASKKHSFLIIPINDIVKAKKRVDDKASLHLAMVTDRNGKIISANIVCFLPIDGKKRNAVTPSLIGNFLTGKAPKDSCMLRFLSITGRWLHQVEFKNNRVASYGVITSQRPENSPRTNGICIDWWLVITIHFIDGSQQEFREYVGQTCSSDCNDPNYQSLCPTGEEGGMEQTVEEIETIDSQEDIPGETDLNPFDVPDGSGIETAGYYPPIRVRHIARKFGYWYPIGIVYHLRNVEIENAYVLNPVDYFRDTWGFNGVRTAYAGTPQNNIFIPLILPAVMVEWSYSVHSTFVTEDGRTWPGYRHNTHITVM